MKILLILILAILNISCGNDEIYEAIVKEGEKKSFLKFKIDGKSITIMNSNSRDMSDAAFWKYDDCIIFDHSNWSCLKMPEESIALSNKLITFKIGNYISRYQLR